MLPFGLGLYSQLYFLCTGAAAVNKVVQALFLLQLKEEAMQGDLLLTLTLVDKVIQYRNSPNEGLRLEEIQNCLLDDVGVLLPPDDAEPRLFILSLEKTD